MRKNSQVGARASRVELSLSAPRAAIVLGGVLSSAATFLPIASMYLGVNVHQAFKLFLGLYLTALPLLAASAYELYRLNLILSDYCGAPRFSPSIFAGAILPLGYVPALQAIVAQLSNCRSLKGSLRPTPSDLLWNLLTLGAYALTYAMLVSRIVELVVESEPERAEASKGAGGAPPARPGSRLTQTPPVCEQVA